MEKSSIIYLSYQNFESQNFTFKSMQSFSKSIKEEEKALDKYFELAIVKPSKKVRNSIMNYAKNA